MPVNFSRNRTEPAILYLNCEVIATKKIFENDVSILLYFYFNGNFKHDNK